MASKMIPGSKRIVLVAGPGLKFGKKPSAFNGCVADRLRGKKPGSPGAVKKAFADAARSCRTRNGRVAEDE